MRFQVLDAWRGVGALLIALHRLPVDGTLADLPFVRWSYPLVDFFFVLSGFVIAHAYLDRFDGQPGRAAGFMVRRFGRIWPLHAFTLGLLILIEGLRLVAAWRGAVLVTPPFTGDTAPATILFNATLTHALGFFPSLSWNVPSWSISTEFWTYMLFVPVVLLARGFLMTVSVTVFVAATLIVGMNAPNFMDTTHDYGFFRCMAGFFLGLIVHRVYLATRDRPLFGARRGSMAEILVVVGVFAYLSLVGHSVWSMAAHPIMAVMVYVFAFERGLVSRALGGPVFRALGDWSYSIYLVCPLVVMAFVRGLNGLERWVGPGLWVEAPAGSVHAKLAAFGSPLVMEFVTLGYLGLVIAASALTFRFVEVPARRLFYRLADRLEARARRRSALGAAQPAG